MEPIEERNSANDADPKTADQSENTKQFTPTTRVSPIQAPPSPHGYQITCKTEKDWRDKVKFGAEIFGLAVLIAYTVFSCLQWLQIRWTNRLTRESLDGSGYALQQTLTKMQGQIDQMHELAVQAKTQADRTKDVADQALRQATATNELAATAQKTFEIVNRPYIGVEAIYQDEDRTKNTMNIDVHIRNFGPVPALGVELKSHWYQNGVEAPNPNYLPKQGIIFAGDRRSLTANFSRVQYDEIGKGINFMVRIRAHYKGSEKVYDYCEDWEYNALIDKFRTDGTCDRPGAPNIE